MLSPDFGVNVGKYSIHGVSGLRLGLYTLYFLLYATMDLKMDFNNGLAKGKLIMFTRIQFVFDLCGCADIDTNDTIRDM